MDRGDVFGGPAARVEEDDAAERGAERDEVGDDVPIGGQKVRARCDDAARE